MVTTGQCTHLDPFLPGQGDLFACRSLNKHSLHPSFRKIQDMLLVGFYIHLLRRAVLEDGDRRDMDACQWSPRSIWRHCHLRCKEGSKSGGLFKKQPSGNKLEALGVNQVSCFSTCHK